MPCSHWHSRCVPQLVPGRRHCIGIWVGIHMIVRYLWRLWLTGFILIRLRHISNLVPKNSANGANWRNVVFVANSICKKSVTDFPSKYSRIRYLVFPNAFYDIGCCYSGLTSSNSTWQNRTSFVVPRQDLAHTTMRDAQLSTDITWSYSELGQLYDSCSDSVGKRSAINEYTPQLVDFSVCLICKRVDTCVKP